MSIYAVVKADSVHEGNRLTTLEIQCHRFVLAEFNTHRAFSRNSASSRAIPFRKQLARMEELGIAFPVSWPAEQSGMQGGEELTEDQIKASKRLWSLAAMNAVESAKVLHELGVHKSVINRILEPFMWHKIIVSSTEWENFYAQRCSPLAQPEIRLVAEAMREAMDQSVPTELTADDWHLPYVDAEDYDALPDSPTRMFNAIRVSAARCARVSYLTHDGRRDISQDLDLYLKLVRANPAHWSPLEHVATPDVLGVYRSNFKGWSQLRGLVESR